jgi:hypothetical protein
MIDGKILNKTAFSFAFTALFYILLYISPSIMHKNAKLPPLDLYHQDKLNELCFKFFDHYVMNYLAKCKIVQYMKMKNTVLILKLRMS